VTELLDAIKMAWFLGGIVLFVLHEWWKRRAPHYGEASFRSTIGEELVYIWWAGLLVIFTVDALFGRSPPLDPSDFYPE
jgi:hypothetical protein